MLSILIPNHNYPVEQLVTSLYHQLQKLEIEWEIRCYEDGSEEDNYLQNKEALSQIPHLHHQWIRKNMGRSAIRNKLAKDAKYPYLLFIDSDMQCEGEDFIANYLKHKNEADAIYGGVSYNLNKPDGKFLLRWHYGKHREVIPAMIRNGKPYISLKTCNLLIKKELMLKCPFDERLKKYGHEDTLHAIYLSKIRASVLHIENPMLHLGLEDTEIFLEKSKMAMQNLAVMMDRDEQMLDEINIVSFYRKIKKMKISNWLLFGFFMAEPLVVFILISPFPSLYFYDIYKLGYLIKACNEKT
jgi:glycosyltransferase involved in cell wall biosynthesis